jgi:uncharacterized membrane protein YebE (DUF533 family)
MSAPSWLAVSEHAPLLQGLHALAWADGTLDPAERELLGSLVSKLGLVPTHAELEAWLVSTPDLDAVNGINDVFDRQLLLFEAIRLARTDGSFDDSERELIQSWAKNWGFSGDDMASLDAEVLAMTIDENDPFA